MHDIACQMVSKWARQGPDHVINPAETFTQLTLDSIAICTFGTRFNSFYRNEAHPFVQAMVFGLSESARRAFRPAFVNDYLYRSSSQRYQESINVMRATARQAIKERQNNPVEKNDLLNAMLLGKDSKTGKGMTEVCSLEESCFVETLCQMQARDLILIYEVVVGKHHEQRNNVSHSW